MTNNSMLKLGQTLQQKLESDQQQLKALENQSQQSINHVQQQLVHSLNALSASVATTTSTATQHVQQTLQNINDQLHTLQQELIHKQQNDLLTLFEQQRLAIQQQLQKDSYWMIWTTRTPYLVLLIALLALMTAIWMSTPRGLMWTSSSTATAEDGQTWVYLLDPQWQWCPNGNQKVPCKPIH